MTGHLSWQPILEGPDAAAARDAVIAIARALATGQAPPPSAADSALFWAYVAGVFDEPWVVAAHEAAIDALVEATAAARPARLYGGLAGAGWVLAHVTDDGAAEEVLGEVDLALRGALPALSEVDLITGLAGVGLYFVERGDHAGVADVAARLRAQATTTPAGVTWHTPSARLPAHLRMRSPRGHHDLGVAHGLVGIVGFLAHAGDVATVREALRWLRQWERSGGSARYPSLVVDGAPAALARSAWCYGDPGIAVGCWSAARRLGLPTAHWHALAVHAAARPFAETAVQDPMVCHGSAGLAHLFNRAYQASGDPTLYAAAHGYLARALADRDAHGVAGFTRAVHEDGQYVRRPDTSFLEGAIGLALVLLAAVHPGVPGWDRLLLCDILSNAGDADDA